VLLVGGLNTFLASLLWFPVKSSFWSIVIHGIVLSIALVITDAIFVLAPSIAFPGIATRIVTFVVSSFVDGFVAKKVAGLWEDMPEGVPKEIEEKWKERNI
jgi:membrane protein implicated in regulation of membrane protease activity